MRWARRLAVLALVAAGCGCGVGSTPAVSLEAPFAAGDNAANIPHDRGATWVLQRWVARHTGRIDRLYFYAKVEGSDDCAYGGRSGYADGTSGRLLATTHPILPSGAPDLSRTLASGAFTPCGNDNRETVAIDLGLDVTEGQELGTVVRNVDPDPGANYFSSNFLYAKSGVAGANGRNERNPAAADAFYGLDPRELVGYSVDAGATWRLPGGPYGGNGGAAFVPTYIQQYADGTTAGQPYYWSTAESGPVTMVFPRVPVPWTVDRLGAYVDQQSSGVVVLKVDGVERARATLTGRGFLRAKIAPVAVAAGQTVAVSTNAGSDGLALRQMQVDAFWADKLGLGEGYRHYREGKPRNAATVYPLPAYWAPVRSSTSSSSGAPPAVVAARFTLTLRVTGRRATAVLRSPVRARGTTRLTSDGLEVARCGGMRLGPRRALRCQVERRRGPLGRVGARAGIVAGTKRVTLARSRGRRVARSPAAAIRRAPTSVAVSVDRMTVVASARARAEGRLSLAARAWLPGAGRCTGAGTESSGARCRLAGRGVTEGVVVSTSLSRAGGAVGRLRVLAGRVAVR